jgi:hypothetical protein
MDETSMLTNQTISRNARGGAETAARWSCVSLASGVVATAGVMCLSSSPTYLLGGESGHQDAKAIDNPGFADRRKQN